VNFGALPKDSTDSSTQQGIYLGSNGFRYTKYDISGMWKSASDWLSYLQAANSLTVIDNRVVT
jgi:exo-beta-1,3-glucanase (GH17 family)